MSSRPGILVSHKIPFTGLPSPNQTRDVITVEIRAHWPHNATEDVLGPVLTAAYLEAVEALRAKLGVPGSPNTWLSPPESPTRPGAST